MNQRFDRTLILLRPDGSNRTWLLTRRRLLGIGLLVGLPVLVIALLAVSLYWHIDRYHRLQERYDMLAGRELPVLAPRPSPADDVPGAVPAGGSSPGIETPATRPAVAARSGPETPSAPVTSSESAAGRDQVRIEGLTLTERGGGVWDLYAELSKTEWGEELLRGYYAVVIEDAELPGRFVTIPTLDLQSGHPLTPSSGESFAIRRFRPIEAEVTLPAGFRPREVRFFVYDRTGGLLLDRAFPVGGTR